jgi:hypothetical protein
MIAVSHFRDAQMQTFACASRYYFRVFTNDRKNPIKKDEHFAFQGLPLFVEVCYNVQDVLFRESILLLDFNPTLHKESIPWKRSAAMNA